jgi:hypothetical protein
MILPIGIHGLDRHMYFLGVGVSMFRVKEIPRVKLDGVGESTLMTGDGSRD